MRAAFAFVLVSLFTGPALAQTSCRTMLFEEGELLTDRQWQMNADGRIASFDYAHDVAAYATHTEYRYDASGQVVERRTRVDEGPAELGWQPPEAVTTARGDGQVVARWSERGEAQSISWTVDAQGRATSVRMEPGAEGGSEQYYCAFDLDGRPVYMGIERNGEEMGSRTWEWRGGRLTREVRVHRDGSETRFTLRRRGGAVELVGAGTVERWSGECSQLFFERCAPIHGPARPDGTRPVVPPLNGRASDAAPRRGPVTFGSGLGDAPLTLADLRRAHGGYRVWTSVSFFENSPNVPFPIVCIGRGDRCTTTVTHDDRGRPTEAHTSDRTLAAPAGARVGTPARRLGSALEGCVIERGLDVGIACRLRYHPRFQVWLDAPEAVLESGLDVPTPAMLEDLRVERLVWRALGAQSLDEPLRDSSGEGRAPRAPH
ncbi:MAG: hypothetical protein KC619_17895 [Myxococcales bacterium]|nr:hypothetical protein [Myxococcales bacterium]